jgi:hypothetical protein
MKRWMGLTLALAVAASLWACDAGAADRLRTRTQDKLQTCDPLATQDCALSQSLDRLRQKLQDRAQDCTPTCTGDQTRDQTRDQLRDQTRDQLRDGGCGGTPDQTRLRTRDRQLTWEDFLSLALGE